MAHDPDIRYGYTRLETDEEFRERVKTTVKDASWVDLVTLRDEYLDSYVWRVHKMQRRIVEVF